MDNNTLDDGNSEPESDKSQEELETIDSPGESDVDSDKDSDITHSVVFKCMGTVKEVEYQTILSKVAKQMDEGQTVPVRLNKEPDNAYDSRAIAFLCKANHHWERIGYVVRDALEAVHQAMDCNELLEIHFDWVKYIVHFKQHGWYAGIVITKKGNWPSSVMRCCAKSFS